MKYLYILNFSLIMLIHSVNSFSETNITSVNPMSAIPIAFSVNEGQVNSSVQYTAQNNVCSMFFTSEGTTIHFEKKNSTQLMKKTSINSSHIPIFSEEEEEREVYSVTRKYINAHKNPKITGEERLPWNSNYFYGDDSSGWHTDVPNYAKLRMHNLYDDIDLVYYGTGNNLKSDYIVKPGANPEIIVFTFDGATGYELRENGNLAIYTPSGMFIEKKPYSYQIIDGKTVEIEVSYKIIENNNDYISFSVNTYNPDYQVIIDPELEFSTLLGGDGNDTIRYIKVDKTGNIYVMGNTFSSDFPLTQESYKDKYRTTFLSKINSSATTLLYSVLIMPSSATDFVIGDNENIYLTGTTGTSAHSTEGAYDTTHNGGSDVYVMCMSPDGNTIEFATLIGGSSDESPNDITVDSNGNIYIAGKTWSSDFPTTPGAFDDDYSYSELGEIPDGFVLKLNSDGTDLIYSTYLGGVGSESITDIAVDKEGYAYITGLTSSIDFPVTEGCLDSLGGRHDATIGQGGFVCKLNVSGSSLVYSSYFFKSDPLAITADSYGNAYVTGSNYFNNFTTPGAYDTTTSGTSDVFVCKITPEGKKFLYATFIGGNDSADIGNDIIIDAEGNAYITGYSQSSDFPVTDDALCSFNNGEEDIFLCKLNNTGSELLYSTYYGGTRQDIPDYIASDDFENIVITGYTWSRDFPVTENAIDNKYSGNQDIFILKLNLDYKPSIIHEIPDVFCLHPAYPNPFNASTTLSFSLSSSEFTSLIIYNIMGQKVRDLLSESMSPGAHTIVWNGKDINGNTVSSGLYFARLVSGNTVATVRILHMK